MSIHYIGFMAKQAKLSLKYLQINALSFLQLRIILVPQRSCIMIGYTGLLIIGFSKTNLGEQFQEYEQAQVNIRSEKKYLTCYRNFPKFSITLYS